METTTQVCHHETDENYFSLLAKGRWQSNPHDEINQKVNMSYM